MNNKTQKKFVVERLNTTGEISRNECLKNYITRLGAIMHSLKKDGYSFTTITRKNTKPDGSKGKDFVYKLLARRRTADEFEDELLKEAF